MLLASKRSAFTLVELLVVIAIIAILSSLVLAGVMSARTAGKEAAIRTACVQLGEGFDNYTLEISGGSYPPNLNGQANALTELQRHMNKAFPSHREPPELLQSLATLTPAEAVVFWLGGFSKDPKYPISGPNGPSFDPAPNTPGEDFASRGGYEFDELQLGPRTPDGRFNGRPITYEVRGQPRQINLWQYFPRDQTQPYVYFDASRRPTIDPVIGTVAPIKMMKTGSPNTGNVPVSSVRLANEGKCQIMSAGLDDAWGNLAFPINWQDSSTTYSGLMYPEGPWVGELSDNIVNFSTGRTLEDSQP